MTRYVTWGLLALFGAAAFVMALGFGYGRGPQIGSAPAPLILSGGIALLSVWGLATAAGDENFGLEYRPLAAVAGGVVLFMLTIETLGLVPATLLTMAVAYLGQTKGRYGDFGLFAALFAGGVWLVFVIGLGLPVAPFGGR